MPSEFKTIFDVGITQRRLNQIIIFWISYNAPLVLFGWNSISFQIRSQYVDEIICRHVTLEII